MMIATHFETGDGAVCPFNRGFGCLEFFFSHLAYTFSIFFLLHSSIAAALELPATPDYRVNAIFL